MLLQCTFEGVRLQVRRLGHDMMFLIESAIEVLGGPDRAMPEGILDLLNYPRTPMNIDIVERSLQVYHLTGGHLECAFGVDSGGGAPAVPVADDSSAVTSAAVPVADVSFAVTTASQATQTAPVTTPAPILKKTVRWAPSCEAQILETGEVELEELCDSTSYMRDKTINQLSKQVEGLKKQLEEVNKQLEEEREIRQCYKRRNGVLEKQNLTLHRQKQPQALIVSDDDYINNLNLRIEM